MDNSEDNEFYEGLSEEEFAEYKTRRVDNDKERDN
jgi:hypothetical protein